jgi:hypothetical protein
LFFEKAPNHGSIAWRTEKSEKNLSGLCFPLVTGAWALAGFSKPKPCPKLILTRDLVNGRKCSDYLDHKPVFHGCNSRL